jgi:hypothetical protein
MKAFDRLLKRRQAAQQRQLLSDGKKIQSLEKSLVALQGLLMEGCELLNKKLEDEALAAASGCLLQAQEIYKVLEKSPVESGVDLVELRSALSELQGEIDRQQAMGC